MVILPCPCCSGKAEFEHPITEAVVRCTKCKLTITRSYNPLIYHSYEAGRKWEEYRVLEAWNSRIEDPFLGLEIKQLREAVRRYCDKSRMGTVEPMGVQQAIDNAFMENTDE